MLPADPAHAHCQALEQAVAAFRQQHTAQVTAWGERLAEALRAGGRLLAAGNGGSAAQAQHLTAELVGRYQGERRPYSAIALHADTSAVTAIGNDYGFADLYARQVAAHGRRGDVLLLLSTSGRSENLVNAALAGREAGLRVWALTGPAPNPLAAAADAALCVAADTTATVQEVHLVAVHLLCEAFDAAQEPAEDLLSATAPLPAVEAPLGAAEGGGPPRL
ncbi:SIS domain-containing protein [Streptomyces smyrnaeus]|uniref:D-sedoheptulose-7-phosphate isomerase n=1 Tax=Streptomyces TaxID=1883 RepID=UPI000C19D911|nr:MULTISPECIES: SIS domain-containing protein [unclassified Streptomyces]MBQ0863038.1 SIS domain-containing protein [Streptomyces sp. RK75]MBQ1123460.1 SIS domain-containing protein [Streptomyces sp. B15]MBQ1162609.1 SIS domain-containing protein [Streptomyces sp. A73]